MKKVILAFGIMCMTVFVGSLYAQSPGVEAGASIEFEKEIHDYGVIQQYGNGAYEFIFTNTGSEPLLISKASGSCSCAITSWPRAPIVPGESASIKVTYDTKRIGPINEPFTITSNAVNIHSKVISIKGSVSGVP